ncbi:MAG: mandelate racemase/muconate lactonizing enzyme family protein [Candidatus Latescibacterota bacterium]|jgi:galactonate dehydratase|nr:mandelate racemase/muconate lactonizing enzyme family protein [Candidatus Latescibacterota bacterium]
MKIKSIELTHLDVPFTAHTDLHMKYWLPHWRIVQICRLTLENGVVGFGETIPNYTWSKVPENVEERIVGNEAASLLWDDSLGAGVQMALFDAVGKHEHVPVYQLLGTRIRDHVPLSWWGMDMPPKDWARQCSDAAKTGYMSAKLKARTWYDLHASIRAIIKVVPSQFKLDFDYNGTLANAACAVEHLKSLEQYEQVAMIESPIPQGDVAGNRHIRQRINRPIAMHYGQPPIATTMKEDVADGFVVCAGASAIRSQSAIADAANKPFWLQLVGTGITTTWAAHLGAVSLQAKWPAITCMNIWKEQLITPKIELRGGYQAVPEKPGLGVELNTRVVKRLTVDYSWLDTPRHVYRYSRASGEVTYFGESKQALHSAYPNNAMPISEAGSQCVPVEDDGSKAFAKIWDAVQGGATLRRHEGRRKRK